MRRRDLISLGGTVDEPRPTPSSFDMTTIGLPVITDGRIRNYIFVRFRLHLAEGLDPLTIRDKDPYLRDSIVRGAHRSPFTLEDDWTRLDPGPMAGWIMAAAARLCGRGVVRRVEILNQSPQRRTGVGPT